MRVVGKLKLNGTKFMADPKQLAILQKGVEAWNNYRSTTLDSVFDLQGADLNKADLCGANLNEVNLKEAKLCGAFLRDASLRYAILGDADLSGSDLSGSDLSEANLWRANLSHANLSNTHLGEAVLVDADLTSADLSSADLREAKLTRANLEYANLRDVQLIYTVLESANLGNTDLGNANLNGANLRNTKLLGANLALATFRDCDVSNTNFMSACLGGTIFADMDLGEAVGLEQAVHYGPSSIAFDTLYKSLGQIPDEFLRDCGMPEDVIQNLLPLIRTGPPIQFHSCFISYSTVDKEFAARLHARMRQAGLRVWFAPEDLKGGKKLHEQLFEAIQLHEKLLLVLSPASIKSEWVMTEIRKAREVERKESRRKLFPILLMEYGTLRDWTCFDADSGKDLAVEVREYFIPDFSNWKDHDAFETSFERLLKDLKA